MPDESTHGDSPTARYRFLTDVPASATSHHERTAGSLSLSLAAHAICLIIITVIVSRSPVGPAPDVRSPLAARLVFATGPGGGGGGGEEAPAPARRAQLVGRDQLARPSAAATQFERTDPQPTPPVQIAVAEPQVNAGLTEMVGSVSELRAFDGGRGPGSGTGADGGRGPGIGPGSGAGIGEGSQQGSGDDGVRPGNGVSWPRLLQEVKPNYTADAMRAKVEGMVELEIVVLPDGRVGRVRITRSLDGTFGLDQEAVRAVRLWRFDPARQLGKPVATRVPVELTFRLR